MRRYWGLLGVVLSALVLACEGTAPEPARSVEPPKPSTPARSTADSANADSKAPAVGGEKARLPQPERLVAIGDLHGDLEATRAVLRLAGAMDEQERWSGGKLVVVQTGDQIDRGDDDRDVLDLLYRLQSEAKAAGGALHVLNGNHETMNAAGDFRYVTEPAFREFDGVETRKLPRAVERALPPGAHSRAAAFLPGGSYAERLAERPVVLIVGDSVFAHGGVHPEHVKYGIDRLNAETSEWLRGDRAMPEIIDGEDAPVWSRVFSDGEPSTTVCQVLEGVLASLLVKRMVVGHTVQDNGITTACNERVFRIDVGMSRYYGKSVISALEIQGGKTRILSAPRAGAKEALPEAAE